MDWILGLFPGGGLGAVVAAALAGIIAVMGMILTIMRKASKAARNEELLKQEKAYGKEVERIGDAARAKPTGSVHDDPYNRDRRPTKR